jgi:hypothetical protein
MCHFKYNIVGYLLRVRIAQSQQLAITRQRPINKRGMVFSMWSIPICYKQDQSDVAVNESVR